MLLCSSGRQMRSQSCGVRWLLAGECYSGVAAKGHLQDSCGLGNTVKYTEGLLSRCLLHECWCVCMLLYGCC